MSDRELSEFLSGVVGVVEANTFERLCLWEDYHQRRGTAWRDRTDGLGETIGEIDGRPVHISLMTAEVGGHKLLFINPTSQVVDHLMIEGWLSKVLPGVRKTDAMNFHNALPR